MPKRSKRGKPSLSTVIAEDLRNAGLNEDEVDKAVQSSIDAIEAAERLLGICGEIEMQGKPEIAGRLWALHISSLIAIISKDERSKYLNTIMQLIEEIES